MSKTLTIPYRALNLPPSEVYPNGYKLDYPMVPIFLSFRNVVTPFSFWSVIDSGADHCVFPAHFGAMIGIPVEAGPKMPTIGSAGISIAYFHEVEVLFKLDGTVYRFRCKSGFVSALDQLGIGLLGREGFFGLFEKVAFDNKARIVEPDD